MLTTVNVSFCYVRFMRNGNTREVKKIVSKIMLIMVTYHIYLSK